MDSTFELVEKCAFTGTTSWRLEDNQIRFRRKTVHGTPLPATKPVRATDEHIERLVAALDFLDIWNWKPDYARNDSDCVFCDEISWSFRASVAGRECKTGGTNAYPAFADHQKISLDAQRYAFLVAAIQSVFHIDLYGQPASGELKLDSGHSVILEELDQERTYAGLLDGLPNERINDRNVQRALDLARAKCIGDAEPLLIVPNRRDYFREPGDMDDETGWDPEWLPRVRCIGGFKSVFPARDPEMHGSYLVVVWYQDEYAPPIDEGVLMQMKSIDWDSSAGDFEY